MALVIGNCIPTTISLFDPYIRNSNDYLRQGTPTTNAERLGVPTEQLTVWKGILDKWTPLYSKYSDKVNLRTNAITSELYDTIETAINFEKETLMFAHIAISPNVTTADLETFGIHRVIPKSSRSIPQNPITEQVDTTLQPIGGGAVLIKCYSGGKRTSIHEDANCVQYRYTIGAIPPTSPIDTNLMVNQSTKSTFTLNTGAENTGLRLYIYFRWFNTKHPELAGPWSDLESTLIL